jgi:hypothetical protein
MDPLQSGQAAAEVHTAHSSCARCISLAVADRRRRVAASHEREAPAPVAASRGGVPLASRAAATPPARLRLHRRPLRRVDSTAAARAGEGADEAAGAAPPLHHQPNAGRAAAARQLPAPRPRRHERRPRGPRLRRRLDRAARRHHLPLIAPSTPRSPSAIGPCTPSELRTLRLCLYYSHACDFAPWLLGIVVKSSHVNSRIMQVLC